MTSHEYANELKRAAEVLLSRPSFDTAHNSPSVTFHFFGWDEEDKDKFLSAVRALQGGTKEVKGTDLHFVSNASPLVRLVIPRDKFCRKVQEERWECEPLLSPEEEKSLEAL